MNWIRNAAARLVGYFAIASLFVGLGSFVVALGSLGCYIALLNSGDAYGATFFASMAATAAGILVANIAASIGLYIIVKLLRVEVDSFYP